MTQGSYNACIEGCGLFVYELRDAESLYNPHVRYSGTPGSPVLHVDKADFALNFIGTINTIVLFLIVFTLIN